MKSSAPSAAAPRRILGGLGCVLAFLLAGAGTAAVIGRTLPFPPVPGVYPKYRHFAAHAGEYDVLFVGSSQLFHHLIPAVWSGELEKAGGPKLRAFNFGYDGMWPPESCYVLRELMALRPARLKWVALEVKEVDADNVVHNQNSHRMAYWHDLPHTRMAWSSIADADFSPEKKARLWRVHADHLAATLANQGRWAEWITPLTDSRQGRRLFGTQDWTNHDGYEAGGAAGLSGAGLEKFTAEMERYRASRGRVPASRALSAALATGVAQIRAAGAQPVFLLPPTVNPVERLSGLPEGVPVWDFGDEVRYAELYAPEVRYDSYHLNPRGAELYSRAVARRFAEEVFGKK